MKRKHFERRKFPIFEHFIYERSNKAPFLDVKLRQLVQRTLKHPVKETDSKKKGIEFCDIHGITKNVVVALY